jgi:hypothetical protein
VAERALVRFLLAERVYAGGPEILELGKHSLENLEPRSRVSYVVDDTRVGRRGARSILYYPAGDAGGTRTPRARKAFLRELKPRANPGCYDESNVLRRSLLLRRLWLGVGYCMSGRLAIV